MAISFSLMSGAQNWQTNGQPFYVSTTEYLAIFEKSAGIELLLKIPESH